MKLSERYATIDQLAAAVPVFPLRGVILLPRATLPLNLFEPRYLQMFEHAMSGSRLVGIIQPGRETGESESPQEKMFPLRNVGCVGRITAYQELDDGRIVVSMVGVARFVVTGEKPSKTSYRTCAVDYSSYCEDLVSGSGDDAVNREALLSTLKGFLEARNLKADWSAITKAPNEQLVNSLSMMSPYGPEEKQALLEAADLKTRCDLLVALAEMDIAGAGRGGGSGTMLQ